MSVLFPDDIEANIASIKNSKLDTSLLSQREQNVLDAKLEKVNFLEKARVIEKRNQLESAAGRMGFDPDGIIGGVVDEGVATGNFVTKAVTGAAAIVPNLLSWAADASSDEGSQLAAMMENKGYASKEDIALLDKRTNLFGHKEGVMPALDSLGVFSNRERQAYSQFHRDDSANLTEKGNFNDLVTTDVATGKTYSGAAARLVGDTSVSLLKGAVGVPEMAVGLANIVSGGQAGKSLEEMGVRFKDTKQLLDTFLTHEQQMATSKVLNSEGFLNTLESIIDNPSTALQFLAESLPAMLAGGVIGKGIYGGSALVGKLLSNAGTAGKVMTSLATHGSQIAAGLGEGTVMAGAMAENLRQQSKDGLLDGKGVALSLAMLPMGAAVSIGGGALASKVGLGDIDKALVEGKLSKLNGSRTFNTVGSAAIEAGEEGLQTAGETIAENIAMNRPWDEGLGNAVAIGMATGATLGGPGGLGRAEKNKEELQNSKNKALQEAIVSGDVSAFTNPESPSYNPEQAVSILRAHSNSEGTSPEVRASNKAKVEEILTSIGKEVDYDTNLLETNSPENRVRMKEVLAKTKKELKDNSGSMSAEDKANKESTIAAIEATLLTSKELKEITADVKKSKERIESITQMYESWDTEDNAEGTEVGDLVRTANTVAAADDSDGIAASAAAVKDVINLAMRSPEKLSTDTLESLISSDNVQYTKEHKELFTSILKSRAATRVAKSSAEVSSEFFDGGNGNIGVNQYASNIRAAIADGDTATANSELAKLKSFVEGQNKKAQLMSKLYAEFKKTGVQGQMVPVGAKNSGEWQQIAEPLSKAELDAIGGMYIDSRTAKVVNAAVKEARAGTNIYKEMSLGNSLSTTASTSPVASPDSVTALIEAAKSDSGKASVKSLTSGTRVDAEAYAALKKELTPEQMKEVNTLYSKNKKPVSKKDKKTGPSKTEIAYKKAQAKQVAAAKADLTRKSKKDPSKLAMGLQTLKNRIAKLKEAIKDPANAAFKETNQLILDEYEKVYAARKDEETIQEETPEAVVTPTVTPPDVTVSTKDVLIEFVKSHIDLFKKVPKTPLAMRQEVINFPEFSELKDAIKEYATNRSTSGKGGFLTFLLEFTIGYSKSTNESMQLDLENKVLDESDITYTDEELYNLVLSIVNTDGDITEDFLETIDESKRDEIDNLLVEFKKVVVKNLRNINPNDPQKGLNFNGEASAPIATPEVAVKFKLTGNTKHTPKDQLKANIATAYIGAGAYKSSTETYANDAKKAGIPVNSLKYTKDDVVFVSSNGKRKNRFSMSFDDSNSIFAMNALKAAIDAGATIITDDADNRRRDYNLGEREVAEFLEANGYKESNGNGVWTSVVAKGIKKTTPITVNESDEELLPPAWLDEETAPLVDENGEVVVAYTSEELEAIKAANHQKLLDMFEEDVALAEAQLVAAEATRQGTEVEVDTMSIEDAEERHESKYLKSTEGKLVFDMTEREGAASAYQGKNLIGHYFMQVAAKVGGLAPRPLVAVKDFMGGIIAGTYSYQDFLGTTITDDQQYLLDTYTDFHIRVREEVLRLLVQKDGVNADYDYMNPIRYFMKKEDGVYVLDENVIAGFTSTMFSWIGDEGANNEMDTNETIHAKMGLELDEKVTKELGDLVRTVGLRRTLAMNALGRTFMQSMGFKAVNDEVPINLQPQVEGGMGAFMLAVMQSLGYTEETAITVKEIMEAKGKSVNEVEEAFAKDTSLDIKNSVEVFVKVRRPAAITPESVGTEPVYEVGSIVEAFRGTHGVMDKLMGVENVAVDPTYKPADFNADDKMEDNQKVPLVITNILDAVGKIKNRINIKAMKVINGIGGMSTEAFETMVGIEEVSERNTHIARRSSLQAKYDGKRREIEHFQDFLKHLDTKSNKWTTPFYLAASYWKNGRAGYVSRINGQTSKIHRWLVSTGMATTVVIMKDMDNFKLRVLEALDVKTDETPDATSLMAFDIITGHPAIKAGVAVIQKMLFDGYKATVADQNTIVAAVLKTGNNLHGFSGLMALANMQQAIDKGQTEFETTLTAEIDGKTNGPMLSMWLLGVMDRKTAEMGGFYSNGSNHKSFSHWKIKGGYDLYQRTAINVNKNVKIDINKQPKKVPYYEALFRIVGSFEDEKGVTKNGRQVVKDAINPLTYGSSISRAIESMADAYIESVYKRMEDISKGKPYGTDQEGNNLYDEEAFAALKADINLLIGYDKGSNTSFYGPKTLSEGMETSLDKGQERALRSAYAFTLGGAVKTTLKTDFKQYLKSRKMIIDSSNLVFGMYNAAFKTLYEKVLTEMMDSGEIPTRIIKGERQGIHALTKRQLKEIQARIKTLEPRFNTSISLMDNSEDSLDRGIYSGKEDKKLSNRHAYSTETKVNGGSPLKGMPHVKLKGKLSHGYELVLTDPGASIMSMLVQNTDSSIMLPQIPKFEGLGVHDALIVALGKATEAGKALNEATINQLLDYSLARESAAAIERSFIAMAEQIKENPDSKELQNNFDEALGELLDRIPDEERGNFGTASEYFMYVLETINQEAARADLTRLNGLSQLTVVDQYTIEAGVYNVPQEFRDAAIARRANITSEPSTKAIEAAKILAKYADGLSLTSEPEAPTSSESTRPTVTHTANDSASTAIGSPNFKADAELEAQLAAGKLDTGAKLVKYLTTKATLSKTDTGKFYSLLLGRIGKLIVKDTAIVYLTKDSEINIPEDFEDAFGWFNMTDGVPTIYIKSSDFKNSAVSMELAIHELLHAAVAQIIAKPTDAVKPIIAELQAMMEATKEHLKDDLASTLRFIDALSDVQEFVTWGMTNSDFQKILINQKYESRLAVKNPLANMAQVFIDAISRLIFGNSTQSNQMSVLFSHVHSLMDASDLKKSGLDISLKASNTVPELEASTLDVFDALSTEAGAVTDAVFKEHLRGLLSNIVDKLHGPFGVLFANAKANMAVTPIDVWAKAKDTGLLPFRSSLSAAGFNLGEQEAFVAEMIQMTMIESMQNNTQPVEKALMKLIQEARVAIKVGDLDNDPIVDAAKRKILFEAPEGDVTGHWRANIIALSLVSKPIADLLMFNTAENTDKPSNTLYGRILNWFNKLLNRINSGMGKAYGGQKAMDKMEVIANRLVDIQAKRVLETARKSKPTYTEHVEAYLNGVGEKTREMLIKVGKSDILRNKTGPVGRIAGIGLSLSLSKQVGKSMELIEDYYMETTDGQLGFIAKLYEEIRGSTDSNEWGRVTLMLTKYNEKIRQDLATHTAQGVMESFENNGLNIDDKTKAAITKVLLRTGSYTLFEDMGMQRLEEILRDPVELQKEIQNRINQLSGKNAEYYRNQSLLLGYYLATGYVKEDNLRMNAHSIARLDGTEADTSTLTEQQVAIDTKIIDSLSSLYALQYTGAANNNLVADLMAKEAAREGENNGVEYTLRVHAALTQQAKERVFAGSELLMSKGYIPEVVNPKTELHFDSILKREELEAQGYEYVGPVQVDSNDVANKGLHMYTLERGLVHRISGTFSTKGTGAAGTTVHSGLMHKGTGDDMQRNIRIHNAITNRKKAGIAKLFKARPDLDPSTDIKQYLAPVSDPEGRTVNYRYIMGNDTRDLLLERNNDFSSLLGTLAANTYDKQTTKTHNANVVKELKAQWEKQRVDNPRHYMLVSEKSTDPEVAAAYRMLPWETKEEIKRVFGSEGMHVRRDMYDLHFGYRKFSIADMFGKPSNERNALERYLVKFFTALPWMGPKAAIRLRTLEDVIQYIVREIKDILVVKSGVTLFWNVISNVSLLMTYGVGPVDLIKYHTQAYVGITKWTKDSAQLNKLELQRASGLVIGSSSELDQAITELKEQLARNPVRGLVEAGMQPTIVEDVNLVEDMYSYKSKTMRNIEEYTDKIPSGIKTAAKWVYMSHDTPLYKLLAHGTQVSDFLAKYTLYMKTTQRANNKLSHADAVKLATAAFVNYDLPSHKGLQYMNDMGLVMFTKYYMRIQHAMLHMYQENPARGIGLLLFDSYFTAAQTIADSSFYNNINVPFTVGPLNYFGAFNDGMIMQGIGKLFR